MAMAAGELELSPSEAAVLAYLEKGTGYGPNEEQVPIILSPWQHNLVTGGGRSGKSALGAWKIEMEHYLSLGLFEAEGRGGLYWLVGADYNQTSKEFEYLTKFYANVGLLDKQGSTVRVDPGRIELLDGGDAKGRRRGQTVIKTSSAKDEQKMGRESPDGVLICEAGEEDISEAVFLRCLERVSGVKGGKGGWLFLSGTIERTQSRWYVKRALEWRFGTPEGCKSWSLATWTNTALYPGGRHDPKILALERQYPDDYFLERMAGIPAPPRGMVFPEVRVEIHVREVEYVPGEPVYVTGDPGYSSLSPDATEVCQIIGGQIRWFDEIYVTGKTTEEIIHTVQTTRPWGKDVRKLVLDPHAKDQHHSMSSVAEVWFAKTGLVARGERVRIEAGIETFRTFVKPDVFSGQSPMVFSPRCRGLLSELGLVPNRNGDMTPFMWEKDAEGNPTNKPDDRNAHAIKAVWYFLVEHFGYARVRPKRAQTEYARIA